MNTPDTVRAHDLPPRAGAPTVSAHDSETARPHIGAAAQSLACGETTALLNVHGFAATSGKIGGWKVTPDEIHCAEYAELTWGDVEESDRQATLIDRARRIMVGLDKAGFFLGPCSVPQDRVLRAWSVPSGTRQDHFRLEFAVPRATFSFDGLVERYRDHSAAFLLTRATVCDFLVGSTHWRAIGDGMIACQALGFQYSEAELESKCYSSLDESGLLNLSFLRELLAPEAFERMTAFSNSLTELLRDSGAVNGDVQPEYRMVHQMGRISTGSIAYCIPSSTVDLDRLREYIVLGSALSPLAQRAVTLFPVISTLIRSTADDGSDAIPWTVVFQPNDFQLCRSALGTPGRIWVRASADDRYTAYAREFCIRHGIGYAESRKSSGFDTGFLIDVGCPQMQSLLKRYVAGEFDSWGSNR